MSLYEGLNTSIMNPNTSMTTSSLYASPSGHLDPKFDPGDITFMILSTVTLWMMIPGCGFFYSGLARSKGAMSMIVLSLWSLVIVSIQWYIVGYSLTFSASSFPLIGNLDKAFFIGVYDGNFPSAPQIPELIFCFYQGVNAALPGALIIGALAERARVLPALLFIFIWNTLVYNPVAYWSMNPNGWLFKFEILDFGGGAPVHVPTAAAALAYSYLLGPRDNKDRVALPHNMVNLLIGTVLIWFGSFGYNAGSAFGANMKAIMVCLVMNLSGCFGALTWTFLDFLKDKKCSAYGLCAGSVVGLAVVTPASGFICPGASIAFGVIGSGICRWVHFAKESWKFDDSLDVFAMHGLAGLVGNVLTGIFAQKSYGGKEAGNGGLLDGNWVQIFTQLADTLTGFVWSFLVSYISLYLMNKVPLLKLRAEADSEQLGVDFVEMGVTCYEHIEELKINPVQYISSIEQKSFSLRKVRIQRQNGNHVGDGCNCYKENGNGQQTNHSRDKWCWK